jgi:GNAT superfamily N-acetyltransferase
MTQTTSTRDAGQVTFREAEPGDAEACARIVFDAFGAIHDQHRFPRDFPVPEAATAMMGMWVPHPAIWGVVAEVDGRIVGSNFLDERDSIRGIGPITIDPGSQNSGVGRILMEAVIDHAKDADGIRLVQDGFHMRSLSLYTSLGFRVTTHCIVMSGRPSSRPPKGYDVRPLARSDLDDCAAVCQRVHGFTRNGALDDALHVFQPYVAERDGRVVAYSVAPTFWPMSHGAAETEDDMKALLLGAAADTSDPIALLMPLLSGLFPWALGEGLRAVKPMNVMSMGTYQEPRGSWYPSVLY